MSLPRSITYTEAVTPPTQMHNIGTPRARTFETSSRTAVVSRSQDNSESPTGIGVTAVWPRPQKSSISDGVHENSVLVNAIGLSCRQVVNQQLSQPSGAMPWEASSSSGNARLPEGPSVPLCLRRGGGHPRQGHLNSRSRCQLSDNHLHTGPRSSARTTTVSPLSVSEDTKKGSSLLLRLWNLVGGGDVMITWSCGSVDNPAI